MGEHIVPVLFDCCHSVFFTQSLWHICQWLLQLILLSHSGTFASDCCNPLCFLVWHNCLFYLEVIITSHSGTFASGCCNFICSLDLA